MWTLTVPVGDNANMKEKLKKSPPSFAFTRRRFSSILGGAALFLSAAIARPTHAQVLSPLNFGLTPVFLTNDLELLTKLKAYLSRKTGRKVELVQRRTYEEITALLLSGQLDGAWICGYPFAQFRQQLSLIAVPIWRGKPLYQSYLIAPKGRVATSIDDLKGDIHAFSDPNSNSGYLVTASLLAERKLRPDQFFRKTIFTYGHRNVVRAVASGLAQSGSVDGYVWEVMSSLEPELTAKTEIVAVSELLGFPPIACLKTQRLSEAVELLHKALVEMSEDDEGRHVLNMLKLDGFADEPESLFDTIAAKMMLVRGLGS
jgi:phosphonate transport system substrate-binding protein